MIPFHIVVALDNKNGIGKDGRLPWHIPEDLQHFKEITCSTNSSPKQNVVIMGRKTWDSLPIQYRPLLKRINMVISRNEHLELPVGVWKAKNLNKTLQMLEGEEFEDLFETVFVIGGGEIFQEALQSPSCVKIYATHILDDYHCDTFFPPFHDQFEENAHSGKSSDNQGYYFAEYTRKSNK